VTAQSLFFFDFVRGCMFQNSPRPQSSQDSSSQREEQQKRDQQASEAVDEAARRMMSDAQQRSLDLQRQNIDGKVEDVRAKERQGASAQMVADKAKEETVGSLEYDLARLTPPSFNEDRRGEIRLAYMRAVDLQAKEIEAKLDEEKKSSAERERRDPSLALSA
jgi:hypothetical protein